MLERRFQAIEKFHAVTYTDDAINYAVALYNGYVPAIAQVGGADALDLASENRGLRGRKGRM